MDPLVWRKRGEETRQGETGRETHIQRDRQRQRDRQTVRLIHNSVEHDEKKSDRAVRGRREAEESGVAEHSIEFNTGTRARSFLHTLFSSHSVFFTHFILSRSLAYEQTDRHNDRGPQQLVIQPDCSSCSLQSGYSHCYTVLSATPSVGLSIGLMGKLLYDSPIRPLG